MTADPDPFSEDADLPPALLANLHALNRGPAVPSALDSAIRGHARAYFGTQRRIRVWGRWMGGAAAAAVLGIGIWTALLRTTSKDQMAAGPPSPTDAAAESPRRVSLLEDIDHNGTVNVLDAFAVARGIKAGRTVPAWDVNRDGVVNQADVDQIANLAVRVKGGRQ